MAGQPTLSRRPGRGAVAARAAHPHVRRACSCPTRGAVGARVMLSRHSAGSAARPSARRSSALGVRTGLLGCSRSPGCVGWSGPVGRGARPRPRACERAASVSCSGRRGPTPSRCSRCSTPTARPSRSARSGTAMRPRRPRHCTRPPCSPTPRSRPCRSVDVPERASTSGLAGAGASSLHDRPELLPAASELVGRCLSRTIHEVAESATVRVVAPSGDRSYWADLRRTGWRRLDPRAGQPLARPAGRSAVDGRARPTLGFGRWHGDWSPWNMGRDGGRLAALGLGAVLDRTSRWGFDAVHFVLQHEFRREAAPSRRSVSAPARGPTPRARSLVLRSGAGRGHGGAVPPRGAPSLPGRSRRPARPLSCSLGAASSTRCSTCSPNVWVTDGSDGTSSRRRTSAPSGWSTMMRFPTVVGERDLDHRGPVRTAVVAPSSEPWSDSSWPAPGTPRGPCSTARRSPSS